MRQRYTVYDPCASVAAIASTNASPHTLNLLPIGTTTQMWQNYITGRIGGVLVLENVVMYNT
jgi:hypothetical protein